MAQPATTFPTAVENTEEPAATTKQEDWRTNLKIPPKDTRVKTEVSPIIPRLPSLPPLGCHRYERQQL